MTVFASHLELVSDCDLDHVMSEDMVRLVISGKERSADADGSGGCVVVLCVEGVARVGKSLCLCGQEACRGVKLVLSWGQNGWRVQDGWKVSVVSCMGSCATVVGWGAWVGQAAIGHNQRDARDVLQVFILVCAGSCPIISWGLKAICWEGAGVVGKEGSQRFRLARRL